jgi:hypothetical protein
VSRRDRSTCVFCGSKENLQAAHVVAVNDGENVNECLYEELHIAGKMSESNGMLL